MIAALALSVAFYHIICAFDIATLLFVYSQALWLYEMWLRFRSALC